MSNLPIDLESIAQRVGALIEPVTGKSLLEIGAISDLKFAKGNVDITLTFGFVCDGLQQALSQQIWQSCQTIDGVESVNVNIDCVIPDGRHVAELPLLHGVKHVIAVSSGKGGVGKSTTSVNLALALQAEGAKVGILDADIYGPSQPQLLGVGGQRPEAQNQTIMPIVSHGIACMSMGFLVTENTPMVWRGPMASGAFQQIIGQTQWGELDYLIVDMPPGTGDIQLTLSQKIPLSGAVIVTTPQDLALLDAKKGIEMFRKVHVDILGVIENMSTHVCSNCGHEEPIFGEGGGALISQQYSTQLLGSLPLSLSIRKDADSGRPSLIADAESDISLRYREIARKVSAQIWLNGKAKASTPMIEIDND